MLKKIESSNAPQAIGPYSQAIDNGQLIFVSGQLPIERTTGEFIKGDIKEQTKQCILNIEYILKEAGLSLKNVVKTTVLLDNINDFSNMNEIYSRHFTEPYPARAAYEVGKLPKNSLIEIEVIASR
ncbi:MAG: RidA family protein [Spirochaetales bacterium]|nr:RidA family protein [Spirochaetales bacterium]